MLEHVEAVNVTSSGLYKLKNQYSYKVLGARGSVVG
jgi:hypothetical protein